jgi:PAS domain-containing protein
MIAPERHAEAWKVIEDVRNGGFYRQLETMRLHKDGRAIPVELTVSPILDAAGAVSGAATFCRDTTARMQVQQALDRRMSELSALFLLTDKLQRTGSLAELCDAALDAIISALGCNRASILLFDSQQVMRFVAWRGLSEQYRAAVDGHSPWQPGQLAPDPICVSDTSDRQIESYRAVIEREGIKALAFFPLVADGRLIGKFMTYYDRPHVLSDDEIRLALNIARQLAFGVVRRQAEEQRRASERSLRDSENRLALALAAGRMGAWEWNVSDGRVIWSPGLEEMHGLAPGSFGGSFEDFQRDGQDDRRLPGRDAAKASRAANGAPHQ